ncbi:PAS domain-containing protein [Roseovarius sp. TE539]|uniref:PAS domain-containing protein n=1 Tax=Roseovarius sp. TE539 TaxID=2249812 RepID=UPI000DDC6473|nr:PAS domain-containing protein [Roseovarius sp. TE539]RBI70843.1 PAS domain-containing protein [Roseovarius sp. TE539]
MSDDSCKTPDHGNVLGFRSGAAVAPTGRDSALSALVGYWAGMCDGAQVPRRSDVDPRRIGALLSNAFIAERIAPGHARLRIAGMHLTELMGMEVRGLPLSAFIAPAGRDRLADGLVRLFDQPATLRLDLVLRGDGRGRAAATGTMVLLPLRSDMGDVSRALGCLITTAPPGAAPVRFDIRDCKATPVLRDTGPPPAAGPCPARGRADALLRYDAAPGIRSGERPYLRLVKSDT